ncbi:uncharacterized protein PFLUO_LOCUS8328 [Penicillium psychrofluorescens]|uniref:uncharacterized protein n=1 Tax=Penicillium psychrofluorescens TaxID=3158075 RepID=UPI003CCD96B9
MADTVSPQESPRSPFQTGVRTDGRAFNSSNWRMKSLESPQPSSPSPSRTNTSRAAFSKPAVPQAISEGRRLYVGNMPYTAKAEDVEAFFTAAQFPIERIDIALDPFTGRNPSYCFVDLESKEQAEKAMVELDAKELLGRPLRIKPGVVRSSTDQHSRSTSTSSPSGTVDRWRRQENASFAKTNSDSSQRVYVGGLPRLGELETLQSQIRSFFDGYTVENVSKLFAPHPAKRFEPGEHYYLFVDLSSVDEAQRAMEELNGAEGPWGGPLRVQRARGGNNSNKESEE